MQHTQQSGSSVTPPLEQMGDEVSVSIPNPRFRGTPLAYTHTEHIQSTNKPTKTHFSIPSKQQQVCTAICITPPTYCLPTSSNLHTAFIHIASISEAHLFAYPKKKVYFSNFCFLQTPKAIPAHPAPAGTRRDPAGFSLTA